MLEDLLKRLCEAIEGQNQRLDKMMESGGGATKAAPKAASKPAEKKKDGPTLDDLLKAFGAYMKEGDSEDRDKAKANVKAITQYFGKAKISELDAKDYPEALGYLEQYKAGNTPDFDSGGGDESLL